MCFLRDTYITIDFLWKCIFIESPKEILKRGMPHFKKKILELFSNYDDNV
jgi:hypothetical protein